jgi:N,N-dimethylformamidase
MHPGLTASWCGPGGDFPWGFAADLDIVDWLDAMALGFDAITDEDLHTQGIDLIRDYDVVITGTHPEYTSTEMWDALFSYMRDGGHLMYLGGNGFYWRTAFHKELSGIIEVRRAEDGVRNWCSDPGEYYHAFTNEYGGLWRRLGRPPQMLVGVGFSGQGFDFSSSYKRLDGQADFLFEGIQDKDVGGFGSIGGGAAGLEIDRFDLSLGSPWNAKLVATSLGQHSYTMFPCPEEVNMVSFSMGGDMNPKVRADMVFFENELGGGAFSVGSIAFAGSLASKNYQNNVSTLTKNVVDYFLKQSTRKQ